jgi:radical SAM superfamily enzyme YgiQ (UPF0313 family)
MYDSTQPNIIILTDCTDKLTMQKALGSYKVAHELRKAGFQVAVINHLHIFDFNEILDLLSQLVNKNTLFVGFNTVFYQDISNSSYADIQPGSMIPHGIHFNSEIKKHIKSLNPQCRLVLGGATAHDANYNQDFDYIVTGYADNSAVNLAKHLTDSNNVLEKSYRSVYGPMIINDSKAEGFDFTNSTMRWESHDAIMPDEVLPFEMARGCIFKCTFCSYPLNGKKKLDYLKDMDSIYQEFLSNYEQFGVTRYKFTDDTFNDSPEKCKAIWEISQRLPFKLEYWAYIRLDLLSAHPKTIDWLFESGLRACFFGIETFDRDTAKLIGKGGSRDRLIQTLRDIKAQWGDQVGLHGSFIFGLPHESMESMNCTLDFLLSDSNPLDSWQLKPLIIKADVKNWTSGFTADIDINYQKFGYRKIGEQEYAMLWENEHTNYLEIKKFVDDVVKISNSNGKRRITSSYAMDVASLGFDLSWVMNQPIKDVNWKVIALKKQQRSRRYKQILKKELGLVDNAS